MDVKLKQAAPGRRPSVCFVAPAIYPVLARDTGIESVGGAEVQQAVLARTLQRAGYEVSVVTMDYGQPAMVEIDGIRVYRAHTPDGGLPVLRFVHPRLTSIWSAMRRADADIYYQRSSGMLTGVVAQFCRMYGRRFIYAAASDGDFYPALPLIAHGRDKWLYRRGLRQADAVVVQHPAQREACAQHFLRADSHIVPSCHAGAAEASAAADGYVLWVGTIKPLKRPELFIELARRLPQFQFRLVGGGSGNALFEQLREQAAALPNLTLTGFVPYAAVDQQFAGARLFVNTSDFEGFPNTFLQAWSRGIPAVSFFDTGATHEGGPVCRQVPDLDAMAACVARLMGDAAAWQAASDHVRRYFDANHTPSAALRAYEQVFAAMGAAGGVV
ncbi:glycosyltransferase [Pseudoduganella sp. FT93W]|uniref:Glycosyltransferase n=1 Tax=Duganella fentianensis TaxID=2692177 RepID=A0A845I5G0_9BURK|nr:glycosyltransferase family 4 protein [Duganella fentianensis]MYN47375.1 glycosyltransferase [Duganella fentianensis]